MKPFIYERQLNNNSEVEMLHLWIEYEFYGSSYHMEDG